MIFSSLYLQERKRAKFQFWGLEIAFPNHLLVKLVCFTSIHTSVGCGPGFEERIRTIGKSLSSRLSTSNSSGIPTGFKPLQINLGFFIRSNHMRYAFSRAIITVISNWVLGTGTEIHPPHLIMGKVKVVGSLEWSSLKLELFSRGSWLLRDSRFALQSGKNPHEEVKSSLLTLGLNLTNEFAFKIRDFWSDSAFDSTFHFQFNRELPRVSFLFFILRCSWNRQVTLNLID